MKHEIIVNNNTNCIIINKTFQISLIESSNEERISSTSLQGEIVQGGENFYILRLDIPFHSEVEYQEFDQYGNENGGGRSTIIDIFDFMMVEDLINSIE